MLYSSSCQCSTNVSVVNMAACLTFTVIFCCWNSDFDFKWLWDWWFLILSWNHFFGCVILTWIHFTCHFPNTAPNTCVHTWLHSYMIVFWQETQLLAFLGKTTLYTCKVLLINVSQTLLYQQKTAHCSIRLTCVTKKTSPSLLSSQAEPAPSTCLWSQTQM